MKRRLAIARGFLLVATGVLTLSSLFGGTAQAVTTNGKITYIKNNHVWVSSADGTNPQQITDDGASYNSPAFSPDHTKVAVERISGGDQSRIYIINADGSGSPQQLTTEYKDYSGKGSVMSYVGPQYRPRWNPAGTRVAFYSVEQKQPGADPHSLFDAPIGGQGSYYHDGMNPEYSPSGDMLGYVVNEPIAQVDHWMVKTYTFSDQVLLPIYKTPHWLGQLSWSPDSQKVAVEESTGASASNIMILKSGTNSDLQHPAVVTSAAHDHIMQPDWSADGSMIAFVGYDQQSASNIISHNIATSAQQVLTNAGGSKDGGFTQPQWSSDGDYILADYKNAELHNTLTMIDVSAHTATVAQQASFATAANRSVKDWFGDYVKPPSAPQVLGTNTGGSGGSGSSGQDGDTTTGGTGNQGNQQTTGGSGQQNTTQSNESNNGQNQTPAVLAESTELPKTGFGNNGHSPFALWAVLGLAGILTLWARRYVQTA